MRIAFLFFFLSALFYSPVLLAQTDSTFTDTIVIFKDPHIIRHEVVISSPSEPARKIPSMKFGLYYGIGGNEIKSKDILVEVKGKSFQNFGIQVGYNFKNLEISTGLGILIASIHYTIQKNFETISYQKDSIILAQNTITITNLDGTVTKITTTKYGEITREIREVNYYNESQSLKRSFIQIPIFLGYAFRLPHERLKITPGIQLVMNKTINSAQTIGSGMKSNFILYGCHLRFEYAITDNVSLELKGFWQQSRGNMYKEARAEIWKLTGINFGINYLIGTY
jgi:hypothetical protein